MRYRKTATIEAFQPMLTPQSDCPAWFTEAVNNGTVIDRGDGTYTIKTLEGDHLADTDDWIARGIKGELYPIKPDIFAQTYAPVG